MKRLTPFKNNQKICNISFFISQYQLDLVNNSFLPKFLSTFNGNHKKLWKNFLNKTLPKHNLGFKNEEEYLKEYNLSKEQIIENSIKAVVKDLDKDDLESFKSWFILFSVNNKVKIYTKDNKPRAVYVEIIEALLYIEQMQSIITKYPKRNGNHHGTRHRQSSLKSLTNTQVNILKYRLDNPFFPLTNEDEIRKTEFQIKFIEYSKEDKYKNFPEWLNYVKTHIGFDNLILETDAVELDALNQLTNFFNGIRTSTEELIKSITIVLREKSNINNEEEKLHEQLSDDIFNITKYFFYEEIKKFESKKTKKTFVYKTEHIIKEFHVKTFLYDAPIYTYVTQNTKDALSELIEIGFDSVFGIKNIFEEDKPDIEKISEFTMAKNLLKALKKMNITKEEVKALIHITNISIDLQINKKQKKLPDNLEKNLPFV